MNQPETLALKVGTLSDLYGTAMKMGRNLAHQELIDVLRKHIDSIPLEAYRDLVAITKEEQ